MKVGIIIITYNLDARIFLLQIECIRKFCKDENYTIEVVDNSSNEEMAETIRHHAQEQEVNYKRTYSSFTNDSRSHSFAANLSYNTFKNVYDVFFYLDHDCIPVKEFSVLEMLGDSIIAGVRAGIKTFYYWPGCLIWNNTLIDKELINFNPNNELRLDTGGEFYKVIEKYGDGCKYFDEIGYENPYFFNTPLYYFYTTIYKNTFLHFIGASNWMALEKNEERLNSLINITTNKINEQISDV